MNAVITAIRDKDWVALIQEQRSSGLTIKQWCSNNGITVNAYYYRLRRLREKIIESSAVKQIVQEGYAQPLVRLPDFSDQVTASESETDSTGMTIRKGAMVIEINNHASDNILSLVRGVLLHAE